MIQAIEERAETLQRAGEKLKETFGFPSFRQGQERAIEAVLSGRDALVIMPTGSGKSLCYQVPALVLPGVTLVVSPLIALMKDQVDSLSLRGVPVTFINSSLSAEEQWSRLRELEQGAYKIVYVAPERFRQKSFRSALSKIKLSLLAIDEAHCISQWGHDFRPDYRKLKDVRTQLGQVPTIALTATATPEVQNDIASELDMRDPERVITGFDRPNLELRVEKARGESQKQERLQQFLLEMLRLHAEEGVPAGIVYTGTRKHAEAVAGFLSSSPWTGIGERRATLCRAYHAGMEARERKETQEDFMEGRLPWVAATNAFGMGVDKSDIRFVIHYDLPGSIEQYYQEVGRAGRDGLPARCLLLFAESDRRLQEFFIEGSNPSRETIEAAYRFLFRFGENPIFRTLSELEGTFRSSGKSPSSNPMVFNSSVAVLERAGALERLDHYQNLAEVQPATPTPWPENPYPERAKVKRALHEALGRVFERSEGEPASISLEHWAQELEIPEESLRRGLSQLAEEGIVRYIPPFRGRAIRLPEKMRPAAELGVDFESLRRRRERDEERLSQVLRFAKSKACRRNAILRHFGEPVPAGGCGQCDGCGLHAGQDARPAASGEPDPREMTIVRKALSGVARARRRCGKRRVIQMLRGSRSQGVSGMDLDKLSTYGILSELSRDDLGDLFDQLESEGLLQQSGDRYPVVFLTDRGVRVMKGEEKLTLAFPDRLASRFRKTSRSAPLASATVEAQARSGTSHDAEENAENSEFDRELFERLRKLRREIASELSVPAYRVFNDRTLKAMARVVPRNESELLTISGVGTVTLERFGKRFLHLLGEEAR